MEYARCPFPQHGSTGPIPDHQPGLKPENAQATLNWDSSAWADTQDLLQTEPICFGNEAAACITRAALPGMSSSSALVPEILIAAATSPSTLQSVSRAQERSLKTSP